jgi:hypothetical protein
MCLPGHLLLHPGQMPALDTPCPSVVHLISVTYSNLQQIVPFAKARSISFSYPFLHNSGCRQALLLVTSSFIPDSLWETFIAYWISVCVFKFLSLIAHKGGHRTISGQKIVS